MSISKNHISQPYVDIKPLYVPLIREELNKRIPVVELCEIKWRIVETPPQFPQNIRITRSMSHKHNLHTWVTRYLAQTASSLVQMRVSCVVFKPVFLKTAADL